MYLFYPHQWIIYFWQEKNILWWKIETRKSNHTFLGLEKKKSPPCACRPWPGKTKKRIFASSACRVEKDPQKPNNFIFNFWCSFCNVIFSSKEAMPSFLWVIHANLNREVIVCFFISTKIDPATINERWNEKNRESYS